MTMESMEIETRDLEGNLLNRGDKVVFADQTYSRTPVLMVGRIVKFEHTYNRNNTWRETKIYIRISTYSENETVETLETEGYDHIKSANLRRSDEWVTTYLINKKTYVSILKVS